MKKRDSITLASDVRYKGARAFDDSGELNASSKREALQMLAALANGELANVMTDKEATVEEARAKQIEEVAARRDAVVSAMEDKTGENHRELGQEMAGVINQSTTRQGFMRQIAKYQPLNQGERPEIYSQDKNVEVVVTSGGTQVTTQLVRDNIISPPEVDIQARPYIEKRAIDRSREDILQRKLNEAEESILVGEDRIFINAVDLLAQRHGRESVHVGTEISPTMLGEGIDLITGYGVPLSKILFPSILWSRMSVSREFENLIDPVTRMEILRTGRVGVIYGATLMTDAHREASHRVLNTNEIYYFSDEEYIGEYTDRGGVESIPIGAAETGVAGLGWHLIESVSLGLVNHRGVAKTSLR